MSLGGRQRGSRPQGTFVPIARGVAAAVPVTGWTELTAPPTPFENGAPNYAVELGNGTILVGAGDGHPGHFWIYDPGTDAYTPTTAGPNTSAYDNLVAGGWDGTRAMAVSDASTGAAGFVPGPDSWVVKAGRGGAASPTACATGSTLYVLDGANFRSWTDDDGWTALSYPALGASYSPVVTDGTSIWEFDLAGTSKYNIGADTWDAGNVLTGPLTPRTFVAAGIIDGKAYLAGGQDGSVNPTDVLESYEMATDAWTSLTPMGSALSTASGCVVDGKLYVFGVEGSPSFAAKARVYSP